MSDLIDRQAVIDLLKQMRKDGDMVPWEGKDVFARIRKLPTIQPEKAQLSKECTTSDLISRTETVGHLHRMLEATVPNTDYDEGFIDGVEFGISTVSTMPTVQPVATDTNVGDKISKFIDGLEETFAYIREREGGDSVCGLCEYDGAYIGESGDWCNECPGFNRDDCFKLSNETRKKWTDEIIKALPTVQPERTEERTETHAVRLDAISRQAAIDAIVQCTNCGDEDTLREYVLKHSLDNGWTGGILEALDAVKDLPPAQPELTDEQAITHLQSSGWMQRHDKEMYESGLKEYLADDSDSYDSLLPSAQPEPKEGQWIDKGWNGDWAWQIDGRGNCWRVIECSECGKSVSVESNFCPHCGADMRGEQDG